MPYVQSSSTYLRESCLGPIICCMVLATVLILNFVLMTTQHVLRLCKTFSVCVTRCMEQEVRNQGKLSWIGAVHTKQRQIFFRTKQCGPMLQRCHQRYGMRCTRYKAAPARAPPRRHHGAAGHKVRVRPEALRRRGAEALLSARGARREAPLGASARLGQSWLGWQPQGLASLGRKVSLNQNSQQIFCWCLFYSVHLIMVDSTQLDYALILSLKSEIC